MAQREHVLFVHGLWMTGRESHWLRRRLAVELDATTSVFDYPTNSEPLPAIVARFASQVAALTSATASRPAVERLHIVAHSLGGLVTLRFLENHPDVPPGRVVFLGSPLQGSQAAVGVDRLAFGRRLMGPLVIEEMLAVRSHRWTLPRELGVVAGTRSMGLGRFFAGFREPNDGTVAVRETRIEGATDHIDLPVSHMGMLLSARAARHTARFLRDGRFGLSS